MNVVPIGELACRETIAALEHLLVMARQGKLKGMALCVKDSSNREHIAFTGIYRDDPAQGVNASARMTWRLTQLQDEEDAQASSR